MRRLLLIVALAVAAGAGGWIWLRRPAAAGEARSLVVVTIDTLRADRLPSGAMPALGRFADGGRRFTHARTPVPLTLPAHASLMTGLQPAEHGARENGHRPGTHHATLARVLRGAGFRTGAFVSAFVLDRQFGLADGFETYDDRVARDPAAALRLEAERAGHATIDTALAWLHGIDPSRERFFLWVHLFEPHAPYPSGYDADVAAADAQVARLIRALEAAPSASSIAWILAGDHGEALGSHGEATHGMLLYDATLRVPLVVRGPGVPASVETAPVSLTDIAPTALRWLGLAPPAVMRGADLRGGVPADRDVYSESMYPRAAGWHGLSALSGREWKAIRSSETELYRVAEDPQEARNVAAAHPQTAAAIGAAASRMADTAADETRGPTPETQQRLRALGYVSGGAPPAGRRDRAANPAREIGSWVIFERALGMLAAGRAAGAVADLAALSSKYPDGRVFTSTYARALEETGRYADALGVRRALVAAWPDDAMLFHDLAVTARKAGDVREAERAELAALALDPDNAAAENGIGLLHADAGRHAAAARAFARAAARDDGNASYWANLGNARRALQDLAGAEAAYRSALLRAPDLADALNGLGVLRVQAGRAAEAVPMFERALAGEPEHIEARLNLGIAYQESGRSADARRVYGEVVARAPAGSREHGAAAALLAGLQ